MTEPSPIRVALDAMGGDYAPAETVKGAMAAIERHPRLSVLLVGDEIAINTAIDEAGGERERISIRHASQVVEMGEPPVEALRTKPDTSIQRCIESLTEGDVDAVLSAGDTGGVVAASTFVNRRLKGVKRPGIAIPLPSAKGTTLLIDVGVNIQCKPVHLLQYAIMASAYAQEVLGIEEPTVGILSVGEEEAKGTDLVKKTRTLLSRSGLNFIGNVEGQAIFTGGADVVVCDGFVGNVVLKVSEGLAEAFLQKILMSLGSSGDVSESSKGFMKGLMKVLDYSATGGAPLLGVRGCVVICHGRSKAHAIANALGVAIDFTRSSVNDQIVEGVARTRMLARMTTRFTDRG